MPEQNGWTVEFRHVLEELERFNQALKTAAAEQNGWATWSRHVLEELKRLNKALEVTAAEQAALGKQYAELHTRQETLIEMLGEMRVACEATERAVAENKTEIRVLLTKVGVYGALGAAIPSLLAVMYILLLH